jgi:hypothetical protein
VRSTRGASASKRGTVLIKSVGFELIIWAPGPCISNTLMSSKPTLLINTVPLLLAEAPLVENITGSRKSLLSAEINGVFGISSVQSRHGRLYL